MARSQISPNKDVRELVRWAEDLGYSAERTSGGHIKMVHPAVEGPVFCASTPSDHRALSNIRSILFGKLNEMANEVPRKDLELGETAPFAGELLNCPACLGKGITKGYVHPQGLIAHMAKEHPAPLIEYPEPQPEPEPEPEPVALKEEDVTEENPKYVQTSELLDHLEKLYEEGELEGDGVVVHFDDLRDHFDGDYPSNAISALKKRSTGMRLKQYGARNSKKYVFIPGEKYPNPQRPQVKKAGNSGSPVDVDVVSVSNTGTGMGVPKFFEESRIFEEINRFVDGKLLLRDAEGRLYQAEVEPLA
ncbi:MAG: type II toxin-antitoxin system HicA family toxin [Dermatophilaceae bacterium]